jgi:hypothetical protein
MRPKARGVKITIPNIVWASSAARETRRVSSRGPVYFKLVFESGWGKITRWVGSTRGTSQRIVEGVRTSGLGEGVISKAIAQPTTFRLFLRCSSWIFVAFLVQPWGEFLNHIYLEQSNEIAQPSGRDEDIAEGTCEVVCSLQREGRPGDVIFGREIKGAGAIVAQGQCKYHRVITKSAHFEQVLHGGLCVCVSKGKSIVSVPFCGEGGTLCGGL